MIQVNFNNVHADHVPAEVRAKVKAWALKNHFAEAAGVVLNEGLRPVEAYFPKMDLLGRLVRDEPDGRGPLLYNVIPVAHDCDPFPIEAIPYV